MDPTTKTSYFENYGTDIFMSLFVSSIFILITLYFYILNNIQPIIADWDKQKCNPAVIPFAGLINKSPNESAFEFTGKNFTGCTQTILKNFTAYAFQPIYYIMKNITGNFSEINTNLNSTRAMFDKIRNSIKEFSEETMGRTLNITLPIVQLMINIKSIGAKMIGTLTASLFTLFGSYLTLQSLFLFIMDLVTKVLYILASTIVGLLIISFIPLFGSWAIPVAAMNIALMVAILIPTLIMQGFMSNVLSLSSKSLPSVPRCFAGSTTLYVEEKNTKVLLKKTMATVEIGDILEKGEVVTAVMKFSAENQHIYSVNGVVVTGEHRLFHKALGWLKVKQHPDRVFLSNFKEPYIYCLGTNTKTFYIGEQLFSDWDDVDTEVLNAIARGLPKEFDNADIHRYLDNGIDGEALVELQNGQCVAIKAVQLNDTLANGEQVLGLIKIEASSLNGVYEYTYNNKKVCGFNVNICGANEMGTNEMGANEMGASEMGANEMGANEMGANEMGANEMATIHLREKYLYQLLTTTGYFKVNGIRVRDYNYGIDKYIV